ncbi:glycosyltransferase [Bauldia sp.]|uniref:glycosyltransferase n=1 Tax=Bauldia sp. TaxID=2575872 RepID=UPI003BAC9473
MSALLIEPHFRSFSGHYSRYVRVVAAEAAKRDQTVSVAASKRIEKDVRATLEHEGIAVHPVFPTIPYRLSPNRAAQCQTTYLVAEAALRHIGDHPSDSIAWLSGIPSLVEAAGVVSDTVRRPIPFQFIDFADDWPAGAGSAPLIVRRSLKHAAEAGLKLYAQTEYLAEIASAECGVRFAPFPPILDSKPTDHRHHKTDRPRIGLMNMFIHRKHIDSVVAAVRRHSSTADFVFHTGRLGRRSFDKYITTLEKCGAEVLPGILPPAEYNRAWASLDAVILPYEQPKYDRQCSGMMFESLHDGIVPIVPDKTSMAALARQSGVGLVYDSYDPGALENAVATLAKNFAELQRDAVAYSSHWREQNSPRSVYDTLEQAWQGEGSDIPGLMRNVTYELPIRR